MQPPHTWQPCEEGADKMCGHCYPVWKVWAEIVAMLLPCVEGVGKICGHCYPVWKVWAKFVAMLLPCVEGVGKICGHVATLSSHIATLCGQKVAKNEHF